MVTETQVAQRQQEPTHETLEDYTLRFAPRHYRRWSPAVVATTALGGVAYLADFSIGAGIGLSYGTANALLGILVAAIIIFTTGFPLAYYGARYNIDLDLVTRGAGFGYYGSVLTAAIFGSFTFLFFATEGAIMAQGLRAGLGVPLWLGYLITTLVVIPLVIRGMKVLSKVQVWTTPVWLLLMLAPVMQLLVSDPGAVGRWWSFSPTGGVSAAAVMGGAGVALSLMSQIGEQVDYLRFMPPRTSNNKRAWWVGIITAGPGWVVFGAVKQALGTLLAVVVVGAAGQAASEPVQQFTSGFTRFLPVSLAVTLAVVLVVLSQIKINVTNAYSGSLAWTNAVTRVTGRYPGRVSLVLANLAVALVLMEADLFSFLNAVLSFYANCAISWVVAVAADIVINKFLLGLSPREPEFRRGMLYAVNPVGITAFVASAGLSIATYFGLLGPTLQPFSPLVAVALALVITPLMAMLTRGRFYLRRHSDGLDEPRFDSDGTPVATQYTCHVCQQRYERPDVLACGPHREVICSLCAATDRDRAHPLPAEDNMVEV